MKADKSKFKSPVVVVSAIKGRHNLRTHPVLGVLQQLHEVPHGQRRCFVLQQKAKSYPEHALSS